MGLEELFSKPLSYVIIRVQVEGVKAYNKDQVALVIPGFDLLSDQEFQSP